jgi:hypothetical protein
MVVSTLTGTVIASNCVFRSVSVTGTILPRELMSSVFNSVTEIGSDLMATYNVNFTMSSLLFAGNTIGYKFYHSNLQRLTYSRFAFGTLGVQFVIKYLGQFDVSEANWSWIPKTNYKIFSNRNCQVGHSPSQAKLLIVMVSSIMHAIFFIMMGSRSGFWTCFSAYVLAASSRAILTGRDSFISNFNCYQLTTSPDSVPQPILCNWISPIVWICFWVLEYVPKCCTASTSKSSSRFRRLFVTLDMSSGPRKRSALVQILPGFSHPIWS